ncbi:MAG: SitI3 family protein [Phototrophicaceae bacterium]
MTEISSTFDLEVATHRSPDEFVKFMFGLIHIPIEFEALDGIWETQTQNFEVSVFDHAADALTSELGIHPTVFVEFRPKPSLETDIIAVKHLLQAIDRWMLEMPYDFALVHNGESVMMYRRVGKFYVNLASNGWTPARLSLITVPYEPIDIPPLNATIAESEEFTEP